jgi:hypothetical protein
MNGSNGRSMVRDGGENIPHEPVEIIPHVNRRHAHDLHALPRQPTIPTQVMRRLIGMSVSFAVHFEGETDGGAVEIENIRPDRVLAPKAEASESLSAKNDPEP